jgi:hypothetical protein
MGGQSGLRRPGWWPLSVAPADHSGRGAGPTGEQRNVIAKIHTRAGRTGGRLAVRLHLLSQGGAAGLLYAGAVLPAGAGAVLPAGGGGAGAASRRAGPAAGHGVQPAGVLTFPRQAGGVQPPARPSGSESANCRPSLTHFPPKVRPRSSGCDPVVTSARPFLFQAFPLSCPLRPERTAPRRGRSTRHIPGRRSLPEVAAGAYS